MNKINPHSLGKPSISTIWSVGGILKKYWYWVILLIFLLPTVISTIRTGIETQNYAYPAFVLAIHITSSDQLLDQKIQLIEQGKLDEVVGMEKPEKGIWKNFVWHWKWFWNVPFSLTGLIYAIFLPYVVIHAIVSHRNTSEKAKNFWISLLWFFIYLFIVNTILTIYGLIQESSLISIPEGTDKLTALWNVFLNMIPFHGTGRLIIYLIKLILLGNVPPMI